MIDFLQRRLESTYLVDAPARAESFLIDADSALSLGHQVSSREALLVAEGDEGVEVALYIDPQLLQRVSTLGFDRALFDDLGGLCELAEGVSHFLYFTRAARSERVVSMLEMEAQAEVDKFVLCVLSKWGRHGLQWARKMMQALFERFQLREGLPPAEQQRYLLANSLARRYCQKLLRFVEQVDLPRFLNEVRHCYRMGAEAKMLYLSAT